MKKSRLFYLALLLVGLLFASDSRAQDYSRWNLPEGAITRLGKGIVQDAAYSPDSLRLAVASTIGIWLYDAPTGAAVALLEGHMGSVTSVAFSPDGKILASGGQSGTIWLWDADSGQLQTTLEGYAVWVFPLLFSPDGKILASGHRHQILLWDVSSSQFQATLIGHIDLIGHMGRVSSMAFSPDGKTLASRDLRGTTLLWDVGSGQRKEILDGQTDWITSMMFSLDEGTLAILEEHFYRITSVAFSPDSHTLASGHEAGTILLWDVDSSQRQKTLQDPTGDAVLSVKFSLDGITLAGGSGSGTVSLWDVGSGQRKAILQRNTDDAVLSVEFSPGYKRVGNVEFTDYSGGITYISFSPDGTTLAGGSEDEIWLWDVGNGQLQPIFRGHAGVVLPAAFSPDGHTLAGGSSWEIWLWDVDSGQRKATLQGHTNFVTSVTFSPDGFTLASASLDETVRLWDVDSGQHKAILREHTTPVTSVAFSPDGKILFSESRDLALLWDVDSGQRKAVLQGHCGSSAGFSPDGHILACWSSKEIRLWDVDSGQRKATLQGHTYYVTSVAFSPDGTTLASGSWDGTVLLWDMSPYITPSPLTAVQSAATMLPTQTTLLANFPNPFNPDTYIPYQLHAPAQVRLSIYDVRGALIREIGLGYRAAGQYLTSTNASHWDGRDHRGQRVASGVYLYRLQVGPVSQVRKMVLVK